MERQERPGMMDIGRMANKHDTTTLFETQSKILRRCILW